MDLERIEALIGLMTEYGLAEMELEEGDDRVLLRMLRSKALAMPS